jgi:DNA-binding NarL/FixJ family response regulator
MKKIRVVIADDQAMMRAGFRMILEAQPDIEVVGEAGDGIEAIEVAQRTAPDVVLMDIRMPRLDGVEATRRLAGQKVVILTTFGLDEYIVDTLRAGASGFLLKDAPPEELVRAVRAVAAGDALLSPAVTRPLLERLVPRLDAPQRPAPPELHELTERELEVLRLLAQGLSNKEIAGRLIVGEATVKTHVSHVLMKLGLRDRVQAVVYAHEAGLAR